MISRNELEIIIAEGKNRQIRRMCEAVDIIVLSLKRTHIGNLSVGDLKLGEYRYLKLEEIQKMT